MTADDVRARLVRAVATHRDTRWARTLGRAARSYLDWLANLNYDGATNGEDWVLRTLGGPQPRVVLDVGAHVGEWSLAALAQMPQARIHAFELVGETAERLRERTAGVDAVTVHAVGLSDAAGEVEITHFPDSPEQSGIGTLEAGVHGVTQRAPVSTGDLVCAEQGIAHVDLLKIDVEGSELQVLRGFAGMLARGAIDVVQFEYGRANIARRALLADLYALLTDAGFVVGKLYPEDVAFGPYDPATHEDFRGPNFIAVRAARDDLVRRLGARA
jgi:FkbM family methyltransferase